MAGTSCCHEKERSGLLETIVTLPSRGWYYGNITEEESERLLKEEPDGAFLVRDATDSPKLSDLFAITFKARNRCGSVSVDYARGYFTLSLEDPGLPLFRSMMGLVDYCIDRSAVQKKPVCILTRHHHSSDVHLFLTKPVTRFKQMHSLQHYCRLSIHSHLTLDKLPSLPLPRHLLYYIQQNPRFDEDLYSTDDMDTKSQVSSQSSDSSIDLATES